VGAKILITGATGTVGGSVVEQMAERGITARLLVRSPDKVRELRLAGAEVIEGDFGEPESLAPAMDGVERLLLIVPAHARQREFNTNVIEVARAAGVRHVVRLSVLGADPRSMLKLARWHGLSEQELEDSGLGWTHVRPHGFMQNFLSYLPSIHSQGVFYGCAKAGKAAMIDARDVATVCLESLTGGGHEGKVYSITGPEALSMGEAAEILSEECGETIRYVDLSQQQYEEGIKSAGMPEWLAKDLAWMAANLTAAGKSAEVLPTVSDVTGREPLKFADFAWYYSSLFRKPAA